MTKTKRKPRREPDSIEVEVVTRLHWECPECGLVYEEYPEDITNGATLVCKGQGRMLGCGRKFIADVICSGDD